MPVAPVRRRWALNARFLTQAMTGVQRYALEVSKELVRLVDERHALAEGLDLEITVPEGARLVGDAPPFPVRALAGFGGHAWEQITLSMARPRRLLNLCNTAPLFGHSNIICCHDLNVIDFPRSYSRSFRNLYRVLIPVLARRAARVTTVSRYSADRISTLGVPREMITVLPNGHEHALAWRAHCSRAVAKVAGKRSVVVLGSGAPHKNVGMLVSLGHQLAEHRLRLVIVGAMDPRVFKASDVAVADNVISTGRLSDDELAALLEDCLCLAFPSFTEGFGLPPLEAMSRGCPVVSSDRASLPEVGADAVLYAAPDDPSAWMDAIMRLAHDEGLRRDLSHAGRIRARRFSWRQSAIGYLKLMAEVDGFRSTGAPAAQH